MNENKPKADLKTVAYYYWRSEIKQPAYNFISETYTIISAWGHTETVFFFFCMSIRKLQSTPH